MWIVNIVLTFVDFFSQIKIFTFKRIQLSFKIATHGGFHKYYTIQSLIRGQRSCCSSKKITKR